MGSDDSEILPRLFTKFATKTNKRTDLGPFISKSIIEAQVVEYRLRITQIEKVPHLHSA